MLSKLFPVVLGISLTACNIEELPSPLPSPETPPPSADVPPQAVQSAIGGRWELVQFGLSRELLQPVMADTQYSFELDFSEGTINAENECNWYRLGSFEVDEHSIDLTPGTMTAVGCSYWGEYEEVILTQRHFFGIVFSGASYHREDDSLVVENERGVAVYRPMVEWCRTPAPGVFKPFIIGGEEHSPRREFIVTEFYVQLDSGIDAEQILTDWQEEFPDLEVLSPIDSSGMVTVNASDRTLKILRCSPEVVYLSTDAIAAAE